MPTILVVDDEYIIASMLQDLFEEAGYRVVTARSGREGLQRLAEVGPDLVLSDMMMPDLDGLALCQAMRAEANYRSIPIVLMTAVPTQISTADCDYIALVPKPFDLESLLTTITRVLNERAGD
jgi:two-component system, OmpR family, alkaline phosphatase synthesis response regulator PhoP